MTFLLLAVASAVAYGVSDFVGGVASRRVPALAVVLVSYPVSALIIAGLAPFAGGRPTGVSLLWGAASGLAMAVAMLSFYRALAAGPMSLVSPLTAVIVAVLPVLVGIAQGERPSSLVWIGIGCATAAVLFVSRATTPGEARPRLTPQVLRTTLLAGALFALSFVLTARIPAETGLWPLFTARAAASAAIGVAALAALHRAGGAGGLRAGDATPLAVLVGLLDVVANTTMLYTFQHGFLSVGSTVISLYPAVTVALAVVILRERLGRSQAAGLGLATAAVVLIALPR